MKKAIIIGLAVGLIIVLGNRPTVSLTDDEHIVQQDDPNTDPILIQESCNCDGGFVVFLN